MSDVVIKKCLNCGATVEVYDDCSCDDCGIRCCGVPMATLVPNSSDGAIEKHKPEVTVEDNLISVSVNHVMTPDHFIKSLILKAGEFEFRKDFTPEDSPTAKFPYISGSKVYSLCNKHGLWVTDVL